MPEYRVYVVGPQKIQNFIIRADALPPLEADAPATSAFVDIGGSKIRRDLIAAIVVEE
jgi:hypothetical protein